MYAEKREANKSRVSRRGRRKRNPSFGTHTRSLSIILALSLTLSSTPLVQYSSLTSASLARSAAPHLAPQLLSPPASSARSFRGANRRRFPPLVRAREAVRCAHEARVADFDSRRDDVLPTRHVRCSLARRSVCECDPWLYRCTFVIRARATSRECGLIYK